MKFNSFDGKNIHLFGGSSGIGLAAAKQLANQGANIFIYARTEHRLRSASLEIENHCQNSKQKVVWISVDISIPEDVRQVIASTVEKNGKPDILINCAGIQYVSSVENFSEKMWEKVMSINLSSSFYTSKYVLLLMKKNKWGRIINIASTHGQVA